MRLDMAMDESRNSQNRRNKRSLVLIAARLKIKGVAVDVRLRNLSCNGALLESDAPPPVGSEVVFERGDTVAPARIAWVSGSRFGVQFDAPIEESEVLIHIGNRQRAEAKAEAKPFRRAGFRIEKPLSSLERYVGEAWFQSLNNAPLGE
jgi:hypothetical protein